MPWRRLGPERVHSKLVLISSLFRHTPVPTAPNHTAFRRACLKTRTHASSQLVAWGHWVVTPNVNSRGVIHNGYRENDHKIRPKGPNGRISGPNYVLPPPAEARLHWYLLMGSSLEQHPFGGRKFQWVDTNLRRCKLPSDGS